MIVANLGFINNITLYGCQNMNLLQITKVLH